MTSDATRSDSLPATQPADAASRPSARGILRLAGIGAVVGGVTGAGLLAGLISGGFRDFSLVDVGIGVMFGAPYGVVLGAILAPLVGWFLLRPVPLGRALAWTMAGSVVGVVVGWRNAPFSDVAVTTGGVAGLVLGAVGARLVTRWRGGAR